jgi:hypothetical protein
MADMLEAQKKGMACADSFHLRLDDDPMEASDLAEGHKEQVEKMKAELESWQQSVIRSLNGEDYE